jgi:hypothetical protein
MMQMVSVPMIPNASGFQIADPRSMMGMPVAMQGGAYFAALSPEVEGMANLSSGFKYKSENIVMAAGQYREVRPTVAPQLLATGSFRFHTEPELPSGLQLDAASGIIWGTPTPPTGMDATGAYQCYRVVCSSPAGSASTQIGIKVVNFQPQNFKITHVSQLERNKYMVLIDTRQQT